MKGRRGFSDAEKRELLEMARVVLGENACRKLLEQEGEDGFFDFLADNSRIAAFLREQHGGAKDRDTVGTWVGFVVACIVILWSAIFVISSAIAWWGPAISNWFHWLWTKVLT